MSRKPRQVRLNRGNRRTFRSEPDRTEDLFKELFVRSEILQVDPEACIPYTKIRDICKSGVARLVASSDGRDDAPGHSKGHSSAGGFPVVFKLSEDEHHLVVENWVTQGKLSETEAKENVSERDIWYGIVDGAHRHNALLILIRTKPAQYRGYEWWVTSIKQAATDLFQAFACSKNGLQESMHIVEFTVYDLIKNMRKAAVKLAAERGTALENGVRLPHGFQNDLADSYCGGTNYASETIRQMAGVVVKLSTAVIDEIGSIVNQEFPDEARGIRSLRNTGSGTYIDCRVYRKTINTCTLRGATKFLNTASDVDRINALNRVMYLARENNYKGTPRRVLEQQVERAIAARLEAEKFEDMLGTNEWPEDMKVFKNNLLRTTKLDSAVEPNAGNENVLLRPAVDLHTNIYQDSALHQVQAWNQAPGDTDNQQRSAPGQASDNEDDTSCDLGAPEELNSNPSPPPSDPCLMLDIKALQMSFEAFDSQLLGDQGVNPFDLIIGDPGMTGCFPGDPSKGKVVIDDKTIDHFAQFSCRALVPGGHLFLFTTTEYYHRWEHALRSRGFDVMPHSFLVDRDSDAVQSNNSRKWPQIISEMAIVARTSGDHSGDFVVDLETPYLQVPKCTHKRKFAAITNAPAPTSRLTRPNSRSLVRPHERAPQVISELLTTFCPPDGHVLDPFANVFTTGISCLATERPCTLLETDAECFQLAKQRIYMLAEARIRETGISRAGSFRKRLRCMTTLEEVASLQVLLREMVNTTRENSVQEDEPFADQVHNDTVDVGSPMVRGIADDLEHRDAQNV